MEEFFFELLQVAIGSKDKLTRFLNVDEWASLYSICKKQSLIGIGYVAITRLPKEQWPSMNQFVQWVHDAERLQEKNINTTETCTKLTKIFAKEGFNICILKGQTNIAYYGEELGAYRTCGDVDVWLTTGNNSSVKTVMQYLEKTNSILSLCYLHAEVNPVNDVSVEVHFRPSFLNSPLRNSQFLNIFRDFDDCVTSCEIKEDVFLPKLCTDYDVIFQLNHLYRHLIDEGVGMRQILDYYFTLREYNKELVEHQENSEFTKRVNGESTFRSVMTKDQVMRHIEGCGMKRFATAVMWVLHYVFNMPKEWMICEPSEKDGTFLLEEIMMAGNFGHHDPRLQDLEIKKGKTSYQVKRALRRMKRNFRFITSYPEEVIFEPYARLTHFWWRKFELWKW